MFFLIPLGIFAVSLTAIILIIGRKFVYLRRLTPESVAAAVGEPDNFWAEMFPEIAAWIRKISLRAYGVNFLTEFEKFLRKMRLISLKIDSFTNWLIHRVRKSTKKHEEILNKAVEEKATEIDENGLEELGGNNEELEQKEQLLIIEIAKNPKDANLYKELGTVYLRMGQLEDAKESFRKAVELDPADETARRKLGRILSKLETKEK